MSRALLRLRTAFDDPLLITRYGRMVPSARALELLPEVRDARERLERLASKPESFDPSKARAQFFIMAPEHIEFLLAPLLLRRLSSEAPGVDVGFRAVELSRAPALLEQGEIDYRIGWWPTPAPEMRRKLLFRDRLVCVVREGHPDIRDKVTLEQYLGMGHVRARTHAFGASMQAVDRAVAALGRSLRAPLRVQSEFALAHVVAQSALIASLPERSARTLTLRFPLRIFPLPLPIPNLGIALYWHERTHKHALHRWFRDLLTETAQAL